MKLIFVLLLALVASTFASQFHPQFLEFVNTYNKQYSSDAEFVKRLEIFKNNMVLAYQWSQEGDATFGVTPFSDMLPEEFAEQYLMNDLPEMDNLEVLEVPELEAALPSTFDWRQSAKGSAVTPVKNQGQCGSCWAFSATENIESVYFLATGTLPVLSPQQIVDCDNTMYGCNGGWPYAAMKYIINYGGQDSAATYPYTAQDGTCKASKGGIAAKISSYNQVSSSGSAIQSSLVNVSPLSICVDAAKWYLYTGGVLSASQCGTQLDHCVQLVGYDQTASTPYWSVRNSWGTSWGLDGYIRLAMGSNNNANTCGMYDAVTTAVY